MQKGWIIIILAIFMSACVFSSPMTYELSGINRNKLLITNGSFCKWAGLGSEWKKKRSEKGTVRYYNDIYKAGVAVIAACPRNGEKRKVDVLAGELASSLDNREFVEGRNEDGFLWQVWNGKVDKDKIQMIIAVTKFNGCWYSFSLFGSPPLALESIADFESAVNGFKCGKDWRWR